uniref:Uncharacterized protein n=1 Tax=viral metagenome TaxID=1070528 RepID=A0A6H1ZJP0_9ZZZZ
MQAIKMLKSLDEEKIPNGSIGEIFSGDDITKSGLHLAFFNGYQCFVYPSEVELLDHNHRLHLTGQNDAPGK